MTQQFTADIAEQPLAALVQIMAAANAADDTYSSAQAALDCMLATLGLFSASIWLYEQSDLVCVARRADRHEGRVAPAAPAIQRVLESGRAEFRAPQARSSEGGTAIMPLIARGEPIGALVLTSGDGEPARLLLSVLADTLAGVLAQARLAEQLEGERRRLQAVKRQQDKLIGIISHDLKNPMASIKGYADLLLRRSARNPDDPNRRGLQIISEQIVRMTELLDTLLDISRIAADRLRLDPRPADLAWLVGQSVDEQREAAGRQALTLEGGDIAYPAVFDFERVRQVIDSVLNNAAAYSPHESPIMVRLHREGHEAIISVCDQGFGIPSHERERIFEPFFRGSNVAARPGMGMSLFVARQILERHNGRIWFESAEGEGSTFHIALPLSSAPARA